MSESETTAQGSAPLVCSKCGAENRASARTCAECGSRLYIHCRHCDESNLRTERCCVKCGRRLGRSFVGRFRDRYLRRLALWEIIVGGVLLVLAIWLTSWLLKGIIFPEPEPDEPEYSDTVHTKQLPKTGDKRD